jgi:hypothetical protein
MSYVKKGLDFKKNPFVALKFGVFGGIFSYVLFFDKINPWNFSNFRPEINGRGQTKNDFFPLMGGDWPLAGESKTHGICRRMKLEQCLLALLIL